MRGPLQHPLICAVGAGHTRPAAWLHPGTNSQRISEQGRRHLASLGSNILSEHVRPPSGNAALRPQRAGPIAGGTPVSPMTSLGYPTCTGSSIGPSGPSPGDQLSLPPNRRQCRNRWRSLALGLSQPGASARQSPSQMALSNRGPRDIEWEPLCVAELWFVRKYLSPSNNPRSQSPGGRQRLPRSRKTPASSKALLFVVFDLPSRLCVTTTIAGRRTRGVLRKYCAAASMASNIRLVFKAPRIPLLRSFPNTKFHPCKITFSSPALVK
jgi:hypothetical protein